MKRLLLIAIVLLGGCSKDALSLAPFPCAQDQTCPAGVACLPGVGCVRPQADALCKSDVDCAGPGQEAICDLGRCAATCRDGAGCEAARICTAASGRGICVTDCSAGQACRAGLECSDLWIAGKKACLPAGVGLDKGCEGEGVHCGPFGAAALCAKETAAVLRCRPSCRDGAGCAADRVCSTGNGLGTCQPR